MAVCFCCLQERQAEVTPKFKIPYVSSQFIVPVLFIVGVIFFWKNFLGLFNFSEGWDVFKDKLPFFLFIILSTLLTIASFCKKAFSYTNPWPGKLLLLNDGVGLY